MKHTLRFPAALLLVPLAAAYAADPNIFVREPRVVIPHGGNGGRNFIGPGMIVLRDGSVLMAAPWGRPPANVFDEAANKHPLPVLYRSTDAGATWQELGRLPVKWRHSGLVSDGGVSFLRLQDDRIAMVLHRHVRGLKGGGLPVICFSSDEGKTWTDPVRIGDSSEEGAWYVMNDRLIQMRSGRLVLPVARAVGRFEGDRDESLVFFSDDGGASWKRSQPAPLPEGPRGMAEPCVIELKDGRLLMLARGGLGVLLKSYSRDGGLTWTPGTRTTLVSPLSSFTLHRLPDTRLIVFYNHAVSYESGSAFPRNPLCYALSSDEGETWSAPTIVDNTGIADGYAGNPSLQIVYPSAVFLKEGILLFYSRHLTMNQWQVKPGEEFSWTEAQRAQTGGVTCLLAYPSGDTQGDYDVCIYGGTSGGVVAAVQAARMGKSVVLIEPGYHLGGMMASGLSWTDVGTAEKAKLFGGLAREVFERIGKHYGQDPKTVFDVTAPESEGRSRRGVDFLRPPSLAFEPKVAEKVFCELVQEAGVIVRFGLTLESVTKEGTRLKALKLSDGSRVAAKVFIDATYEGDLMARAGVSYTYGREANSQYGEKSNGVRGPEHGPVSGKFSVKVDPFVKPGDPSSGHLPLIQGGAPEPPGSADKRIQSYNYRLCLTDDPANRVPLEPPANYHPEQWELLGRYIEAMKASGANLTLRSFCKYDPLPNRKYDFNNRGPISTDMLGGADRWPEASPAERAQIARAHEEYLRGFFHFLRTDPRVPENVRQEVARFGLPRDEFPDNGHWPYRLYVREARRLVSDLVMTEHHILNKRMAPHPIALATYSMDIHAVRRVYQNGQLYNEGFGAAGGKPAPIGYGAIVPKRDECENLLVTFAISASHAAFGSIRMEPVFMVISQSAGTAAVLSINDRVPVQAVDYTKLRARLLADGQILDPTGAAPATPSKENPETPEPLGILLDDPDAKLTGTWAASSRITPLVGSACGTAGRKQEAVAVFIPEIPEDGRYEVRLLYTDAGNCATNTPVTIRSAEGRKTVVINGRKESHPPGVFQLAAGHTGFVTVSNRDADGFVVVDAAEFKPAATVKETRSGALQPSPPREPVQLAKDAKPADVDGRTFDLVVIGATPGGIACAVRAAREGLSVLLTQHNRHLGGMLTNGLMQWDALYGGPRAPVFNQYARMIEEHYRKTCGENSPQYRQARYTQEHYPMSRFEPSVAEREFNRLVAAEKKITLLLGHYPSAVERNGALLRSVTLREYGGTKEIRVRAAAFADATYEGDLAALAKVPYRVGREGRDEYGEPHAGIIFTNIKSARGPRDAVEGRLNLRPYGHVQGSIDPNSPQTADRAIQAYNYRFCLTNEVGNRRLLDRPPPGYNREEYVNFNRKNMNAGALNGKSSWNAAILPGENHAYPDATWPEREKIIERHKNFALGLMYFLQNDESVRPELRARYRQIGLPLDEYPDNDNIPYEMYVREARRIVGRYVYREQDNMLASGLDRAPVQPDSIAFTDWPMDSHDCTTDRRAGYDFDGKLILTEESRPGQIPYRTLLPQGVDNLLVPVCLSATHVAWGAVRLEPVFMQTGEAAGFAAALARKRGVTPAALDSDLLVRTLCKAGCVVTFFNEREAIEDPAAQYFGTKGFFASYDAKLDEPLTEAVKALWEEGFQQLQNGTLNPMQLAKAVHAAETQKSPATGQKRGDFLLDKFHRL